MMNSRKWIALLVLGNALLLALTACAQSGSAATEMSEQEISDTLIRAEETKWGLHGEQNFLTMADSYADDFINIGWFPTGAARQTKQEAFAMEPPPAGPPPELSDFLVVHPNDGSAIVTYKVTAPWATLYATSVYAQRDGEWKTVFYQATDTAAPAAMAASSPQAQPVAESDPQTAPSDITVTFAAGSCSMANAAPLQSGQTSVTLDAQDQDRAGYAAAFMTLDQGKTFQDLIDAASKINADKPAWANQLSLQDVGPGESRSYSIALGSTPVYLLCFSWNDYRELIGYEGPLEVSG